MKRMLLWIVVLICSLSFTSCIDVFQHVAIKNGNLDFTLQYTFQKMLFESAAAFSGEDVDYEEMLGESEDFFDPLNGLAGQYETIENELEMGVKVRVIGPIDVISEQMAGDPVFVPILQDGNYMIVIPSMSDGIEDSEETDMAMAFFASSKYTILISLEDDLRKIKSAELMAGFYSQEIKDMISIDKYGSSLLIEIPMVVLFSSPYDIILELI